MSLNPVSLSSNSWNYSKADAPNYMPTLTATVLGLQEVQRREYNPGMPGQGAPSFWPDGKPRMNIRMIMVDQMGQLKTFIFQPAGKAAREGKKRSIHMDLFALTGNTNMMDLVGKTIVLSTHEPEVGHWGQGNPRPFEVALAPEGVGPFQYAGELPAEYKLAQVLCNEAASGGQMNRPPMMQPAQQPQPISNQQWQAMMGYPQQQMQPQPQPPIPPMPQPQPQQMPAPMPVMDPNVMAMMQQLGATNVQPVQQMTPYDSEIPF